MQPLIVKIKNLLENSSPAFQPEFDKNILGRTCNLYAERKANISGRDFLFLFDLDKLPTDLNSLKAVHEDARKYANSFYRLPKWMRFKCPNITTLFLSSKPVSDELIDWSSEPTRSGLGGEFHSVFFFDLSHKKIYGQGKNRVRVKGVPLVSSIEFKNIDPQNRSHILVEKMGEAIF